MMLVKIKTRLAALGILSSEGDTSQDKVLGLMIADAEAAVLGYCHRKSLPEGLEHVVREIVVRTVRADNAEGVASIKRGDTQINYGSAISEDNFTDMEKSALNAYRRLRVG